METYPEIATERFDKANFHISYSLYVIKKFIKGDILEVGAGCGSFTRNYYNNTIKSVTLTEPDRENFFNLKSKFHEKKNVDILDLEVEKIEKKFDSIMYLHVLEHIKNDLKEIKDATNKLNNGGHLIIIAPAYQSCMEI